MQILANGKQRFYSFMEFYLMNSKNQGGKIIIVPLQKTIYSLRTSPLGHKSEGKTLAP